MSPAKKKEKCAFVKPTCSELWRDRDSRSVDIWVGRHHRAAFQCALGYLGSKEDAEDAVAEGYETMLRRFDAARNDDPCGFFLGRLLPNVCLDLRRRDLRRRSRTDTRAVTNQDDYAMEQIIEAGAVSTVAATGSDAADPVLHEVSESVLPPEADLEMSLERDHIYIYCLNQIKALQRKVYLMNGEGMSHKEIAQKLGITVQNSRIVLHRARFNLGTMLIHENEIRTKTRDALDETSRSIIRDYFDNVNNGSLKDEHITQAAEAIQETKDGLRALCAALRQKGKKGQQDG